MIRGFLMDDQSKVYRSTEPAAESYMKSCMKDSSHDTEHIYRVLNYALSIAKYEEEVDTEILTIACLLHDIGRSAQFADSSKNHAVVGADKAYKWLIKNGYSEDVAIQVKNCIKTHRYRSKSPPQTLEAKILYDADKIDACGAIGIARSLLYAAEGSVPLYLITDNQDISDGLNDTEPSFMHEYKYKLEQLYDKLYTKRGAEIAAKRKSAAKDFYISVLKEAHECYTHRV